MDARQVLMNLSCGGLDCDGCCRRKKSCPIDTALSQLRKMVEAIEWCGVGDTDNIQRDKVLDLLK